MHEDIGDTRISLFDRILYLMGDVMPVSHGNPAIHPDMQVNVIRKTHFPDQTFLNIKNSRNRDRRSLDNGNDLAAWRGVQHLVQGWEKEAIAVRSNDGAGEKRGP